ncbi:MAG TPA: hypothetical protein VN646_16755 [Candidatus Acidoferrum sp.]|jgi:hypothetical protein|nr:hypothetical protein [Candidatus Acidoferrum sp.]
MHDAIAAETRGIPAVAIMTDRFVPSARTVAELNGLADYPFVVIEHPIANDGDEDLRRKADAVVARIVALLTRRGGS